MTTISNLTELAAAPASNDIIPIVDVSAAVGEKTKKITVSNLLSGSLSSVSVADGTEAAPSITFADDPDTGIYRVSDNQIGITVGGTTIFRLRKTGTGVLKMGWDEEFGELAPYFMVDGSFDVPAIVGNNLLLCGLDDGCDLALRRINGSNDTPTTVLADEWCGQLYWWPYDGTGFSISTALYGGATASNEYDSEVGAGTAGPYNFTVELGEDSPADIAVFVETTGSYTMHPANLKTLTAHYTFTYNNGTNACAVTFTAGNYPTAGQTIWVFKRVNWAGTNPFYGRQGSIKVQSIGNPSQTNRGGIMLFTVCKEDQIVDRPRMWLNGDTGNLVIAGKAIAEGDANVGRYYPDRLHIGADYECGCPADVTPLNWSGKATLTIPCVDATYDGVIAFRNAYNSGEGIDLTYTTSNDRLYFNSVTGDTRTARFYIGAGGNIIPNANKDIDLGSSSYAFDDAYADDFNNVADFLHLDSKDDLAAIRAIKGSGKIDPRTGLEMIDDATVPEWMLTKDKGGKEIVYTEDGKPYISMKMMTSLLMGACRKLDKEITLLKKRLKKLEA